MFERSVIFQSNSLLEPLFIKYSEDPFSPGTSSPRLSLKNQSGSSACSNASCIFSGAWGCHLLLPPHLPPEQPLRMGLCRQWSWCGSKQAAGGPDIPFLLLAPKQSFIHSFLSLLGGICLYCHSLLDLGCPSDLHPAVSSSTSAGVVVSLQQQQHCGPNFSGVWLVAQEQRCKSVLLPLLPPVLPPAIPGPIFSGLQDGVWLGMSPLPSFSSVSELSWWEWSRGRGVEEQLETALHTFG